MTDTENRVILIEHASERLRQERETFNQRKSQENTWFFLRLAMGYTSMFLLGAVIIISAYILFEHSTFPDTVVTAAGAALFVDVLGLLTAVWKVVLIPSAVTRLEPVTVYAFEDIDAGEGSA